MAFLKQQYEQFSFRLGFVPCGTERNGYMKMNKLVSVGASVILFFNMIVPVSASDLIVDESFDGFSPGSLTGQVSRTEWVTAVAGNVHSVEFISESEGDVAIQLLIGSEGKSGGSVSKRGIDISKSFLVRETVKVSDTNRRILFRMYDSDTKNPVYAVQLLNGNVVAMDGTQENIVSSYKVDTEYELEMRVTTDSDASTQDTYDLYIDGVEVAAGYKMPRNITGNIKQIELMEAPSWAVGGTSVIDDFYMAYYTPVIRVLESIEATVDSSEMAVGRSSLITLKGFMSDGSEAKLQNAQVSFKSDNKAVATVDDKGNILAVADGNANITVTVKMGDVTLTEIIKINVIYKNTVDVVKDDFEGYDEGDFLGQNKKNYNVQNLSGVYPVIIEKDEKDNKYLRFVMEDLTGENDEFLTGKSTVFQVKNLALTESFSLKSKIKVNSFANSARVYPFFIYDELGTRALTILIRSGKITAQNGNATVDIKEGLPVDTWYDIELVIYHDGDAETEDYYDVYLDGELLKEGLKMQSKLGKVTSITYMENTNYAPFSVFLDDISLTSIRFPKVEKCYFPYPSEEGKVSPYSENVVIKYNNNMVGGEDKIKVYNGEKEVETEIEYSEKEYTVNFKKELLEDTTYKVVIEKGMTDSDGLESFAEYTYEFTTGVYDFNMQLKADVTPGNSAKAEIAVRNNTKNTKNAELILVQYNAKGQMISYNTSAVSLNVGENDLSREILYDAKAKYFGVYLWDGIAGQNPICREKILPENKFLKESEECAEKIHVKVKDFDEVIEICGNIGDKKEKSATLVIYSPEKEVVGILQGSTDINGNYSFVVPFFENIALNETYKAVIMGDFAEFVCKGKTYADTLLNKIVNADKAEIYDIIKANNDYFNVDFSENGDYDKLTQRAETELWEKVSIENFVRPEEVEDLINEEILRQKVLDELFEKLECAKKGETVIEILEEYADGLKIDLTAEYGYALLEEKEKNDLGELFVDKEFAFSNEAKEYFDEQVLLSLLNNKNWKKLEEVINNNKDVLNVEFSDNYNKLHEIDKADFMKNIEAMGFSSLDDFKKKFDDALAKIKIQSKPSGSGGSGSGGSVSYTVQSVIEKRPEKEEQTEIKFEFSDVSEAHWACEYIKSMSSKKLVSGYSDGTFKPDKDITRAEFIKIIVEAFGLLDENAKVDFYDMDESAWYYKYVASAVKAGVVTGYENNCIGGNDRLTRENMAVIIYRAAKNKLSGKEMAAVFSDSDKISDYAKEAVSSLCVDGIMNGMGNNTFNPKGNATRAMVVKVIDLICKEG